MSLYSYCLRIDDGAAPNPYWGVCSLVICKPTIRRTAKVGDWVVGHGSRHSPLGDISDSIVYAMRIDTVLSMQEYDQYCQANMPAKIPATKSRDRRRRVGDCIYDFGKRKSPRIRTGVHGSANQATDLSGMNALLSEHFFYFGDAPIRLPRKLHPILHPFQGHKCRKNAPYEQAFIEWIEELRLTPGELYGDPQLLPRIDENSSCTNNKSCERPFSKKKMRC
jgi:hypothetical protein